ncbi:hypothetical protein VTO73DRAFT_10518 [Trametes versicolor]
MSSPLTSLPATPEPEVESIRPTSIPVPLERHAQDTEYSTDHVNPSSPRRTAADGRRKGWKKRRAALRLSAQAAMDGTGVLDVVEEAIEESASDMAEKRRQTLESALDCLLRDGLSFGDLALYVSDPESKKGTERFYGLFSIPGRVEQILDFWAGSRNSRTGQKAIHAWAIARVKRRLNEEGHAATQSNLLQARTMEIDPTFVLDFSFERIRTQLAELCPTALDVFRAFSTTTRQEKEQSTASEHRKDTLVTAQTVIALAARSQNNSYVRQVLGLYAYASGAQRQVLTVLSHLGITCSYPALTGNMKLASGEELKEDGDLESEMPSQNEGDEARERVGLTAVPQGSRVPEGAVGGPPSASLPLAAAGRTTSESTQEDAPAEGPLAPSEPKQAMPSQDPPSKLKAGLKRALGLLRLLSDSTMRLARGRAQTHLLANVYDNINMMFRIAEQVLGRTDSQQNGTCATAFELFGASLDDMKTEDVLDSFVKAPTLALDDILLTEQENADLTERLEHTVLRIVVGYGGERFARFRNEVDASLPTTEDKIPVHKTAIYPLPAMNIDESTTTGNADVLNKVFENLTLDINSPDFTRYMKVVSGDQLSIARIRSLVNNRAGHESLGGSFLWALCMPGLFHYKMAATHGLLELHFGSRGQTDPASLTNHNTTLMRKPIVLTSPPPFRTSRDLIFVSLYSRVLHCLLLVSGGSDLDTYASTITFSDLRAHAKALVAEYANAQVAQELREKREEERRAWETTRQEQRADASAAGPDDTEEEFSPETGDDVLQNARPSCHSD